MRFTFPLLALLIALIVAGCGGGSGSYSPPPASTSKNEPNLMRSERGSPLKRNKREDPIETVQRPPSG